MKELSSGQHSNILANNFANNNGSTSGNNNVTNNSTSTSSSSSNSNSNNQRKYAVLSTEWVSAISEELDIYPLSDTILKRLAEDASYRLREVLHKCVTRLNHSRRRKLTCSDVNSVLLNLCDADPVYGSTNSMPSYHNEAQVFVPNEDLIDIVTPSINPINLTQSSGPCLQEYESVDSKLIDCRQNYAKRALKTLFNGSQKTFQVLLNDCTTNSYLAGEGVVDTLISIARSTVISNNAQYTRVTTRTCQLIIAIASNSQAVYPYYLNSVDKLTELLIELLLSQSFINPTVESLFKTCALKLMLRWPFVADKFFPVLKNVLFKDEKDNSSTNKIRISALELLAGVQPLVFFQEEPGTPLSLDSILKFVQPGSTLWHRILLSVYTLLRSNQKRPNLHLLTEHFGDSLLPYIITKNTIDIDDNNIISKDKNKKNKTVALPIIVRSKIKYAKILGNTKNHGDRQIVFPDSVLRGPRREIRFAFAGGRPVAPNNLRRISLRASYQILRSDTRATVAHVASHRLLMLKNRNISFKYSFDLANTHL